MSALSVISCGRPATLNECEQIIERVARLEMKDRGLGSNAKEIERAVQEYKKALRETTLKDCVGKRITNGALACVREATTAKQIVEDCFH